MSEHDRFGVRGKGDSGRTMSRRALFKRAAALGVSVTAAGGFAAACGGSGSAGSGGGGGGSLKQFRIGVPEFKTGSMFRVFGVEKGFFKEMGLDAKIQPIASGTTTVRGVVSGELEMGSAGPSGLLAAVVGGAALTMPGALSYRVPHLMYVQEDIQSLEDLAGKQVAGGQPGALLQALAQAVITKAGMAADSVNYVNIGGSPDVFQALVAGQVAAGVAGYEYSLELEKDPSIPVKVLFPIADRLPNYIRNVECVSTRLVESDPDLVARGLAAYVRGARYVRDNKDEAVAWAVDTVDVDEKTAAAVWKKYVQDDLINFDYELSREAIEVTQQVTVDTGELDEPVPIDDFFDPKLAQRAVGLIDG